MLGGVGGGERDDAVDTPKKSAANLEVMNPFMECFLKDSRASRGAPPSSEEESRRGASAADNRADEGAAAVEVGERQQIQAEMAQMEASLRFMELDLVSLIERSRDDLYEIDFWRCAPEHEILAARRSLQGKDPHESDAPIHTQIAAGCASGVGGGGGGPKLASGMGGGGPQLAKQILTPKGGDVTPHGGGGGAGGGIEHVTLAASNNQAAATRAVPHVGAQLAKMRQRGGASRVELQMLVAELEREAEEERSARLMLEHRLQALQVEVCQVEVCVCVLQVEVCMCVCVCLLKIQLLNQA